MTNSLSNDIIFVHATQETNMSKFSSSPWVLDKTGAELAELIKTHGVFLYMEEEDTVYSYHLTNIVPITEDNDTYYYIFTSASYYAPRIFYAIALTDYPTTRAPK